MTHQGYHEFLSSTHLQGERHGRAGVGPLQPQPVRQGEAGLGVLKREEGRVNNKVCPMYPQSSRDLMYLMDNWINIEIES